MASNGPWIEHFPGQLRVVERVLVTKGMAPYGAVALGEIDEVCERLRQRQSEPDAWREEWCAMGSRLEKVADQAAGEGHAMTAGNYYLRAGMYYFTGERFVHPGEQKREIGRKAHASASTRDWSGATPTSNAWKCRTKTPRCRRCS